MEAPTKPTPEAAAQQEARARILEAAFHAFMENGYRRTSTLEIATRARVSKRDLYALVGNKEAILRACVASRAVRMAPPGALPPAKNSRALVETLTRFGARLIIELCHPSVVGIHRLAISEAHDSPELHRELVRTAEANRSAVAGFLADAQASGLIGDGDAADMAEVFLDLVAAPRMLLRVLTGGEALSAEQARRRAAAAAAALARLYAV